MLAGYALPPRPLLDYERHSLSSPSDYFDILRDDGRIPNLPISILRASCHPRKLHDELRIEHYNAHRALCRARQSLLSSLEQSMEKFSKADLSLLGDQRSRTRDRTTKTIRDEPAENLFAPISLHQNINPSQDLDSYSQRRLGGPERLLPLRLDAVPLASPKGDLPAIHSGSSVASVLDYLRHDQPESPDLVDWEDRPKDHRASEAKHEMHRMSQRGLYRVPIAKLREMQKERTGPVDEGYFTYLDVMQVHQWTSSQVYDWVANDCVGNVPDLLFRNNIAGSTLIALQPQSLASMGVESNYIIEWAMNCVERLKLARSTIGINIMSLRKVKMSTLSSMSD